MRNISSLVRSSSISQEKKSVPFFSLCFEIQISDSIWRKSLISNERPTAGRTVTSPVIRVWLRPSAEQKSSIRSFNSTVSKQQLFSDEQKLNWTRWRSACTHRVTLTWISTSESIHGSGRFSGFTWYHDIIRKLRPYQICPADERQCSPAFTHRSNKSPSREK